MIQTFNRSNYKAFCRQLANVDTNFKEIIAAYGYPPYWVRPNTFATLVLTILEQQVSLASAYAAYQKLLQKAGVIEPEVVLQLTDEELRSCYFSRQKIGYVRGLALAILAKQIDLKKLKLLPDDEVRAQLKALKGIGDWTVDIYLLHTLRRTDVFPIGDLALVNGLKIIKQLPATTPKEALLEIAKPWQPYRSIATMVIWHYYIKKRGLKIIH